MVTQRNISKFDVLWMMNAIETSASSSARITFALTTQLKLCIVLTILTNSYT